jgi:hypothetical protein
MKKCRELFVYGFVATSLCLVTSTARADVPAGYTGTPYMGTPRAIPGRVNLIDFDDGGSGVGYQTVHQNGDVGCAGYDYRPHPVPTLCKTSATEGDHWSAGPMMGTQYPSTTTSDYYVGAIRPGDWVQVTVDVKTAGMYQLSTSWASAGGNIDVKISMNGTLATEFKGPATGDYHNWVPGPNFAQVMLNAGVQVMRFQSVVEHVNMDYVQFTLVGPGGTLDPSGSGGAGGTGAGGTTGTAGAGAGGSTGSTGTAGAGGSSGSTGAAGNSAAGGSSGTTGASGGVGSTGTAGDTSMGTGSAGSSAGSSGSGTAGDSGGQGTAGAVGGSGAAGTSGTGAGGSGTSPHVNRSSGGCALGGDARPSGVVLALAALGAVALASRRRSRRR